MKGIELARAFFEEYGVPMIEKDFADKKDRIAVGLVGHGSECFGFDDEISKDHDYEPGFMIWLTDEDNDDFGFRLFRAYRKLPKEYMGVKSEATSVFGADTRGVKTIKEFYKFYTGTGELPQNNREWLSIPDFYLAEATNGEVFVDPLGKFTSIREGLKNRPDDVRLKKLASAVFYMAQSGQYNYGRCLSHGEKVAAAVALSEFVKNTASAVFLLNEKYAPYYKWTFRAMKSLSKLSETAIMLEELVKNPLDGKRNFDLIEKIAVSVADEIRAAGLSERTESYLEGYAYCINNNISDGELRNSPVML